MTPEQITALRQKYNIKPISETGTSTPQTTDRVAMARELVAMRKQSQTQPLKSEKREGFISKVGSDLERRAGQLRETYEQTATGEINPAETGIRTIGSLVGGISDVAFRAAGGILKGLTPDVIEKPITEGATKLLKKVGANPIVSETITTLKRLAEENPRAAKDISALIDIASVFPVSAGTKATKPIISAAEKAVSRTTQKSADIVKYGITQATGLGRETVEAIIKNPEAFSKKIAQTLSRESLGSQVKNAINKRLAAQSTLGTEYNVIRKMSDKVVNLGGTLKDSSLKKFGLQMKDGIIKMTAESKPFSTSELKTIENFIETYGRSNLSPNAVLNAREALSNIAKFESGKTGTLINWAKDVRANLNKVAQKQLPKLKQLDDAYSAEARVLKQIKKDYFKQGSTDFKDNALGRLANLTKEGRQPILNRLKEFVPDIEKKVNILRAIEDIKAAGGIKVGTYVKGGLALGGAMSGNIPLLLGAIFAQPEVIVPILRAWGKFRLAQKGLVEVIIKKLETGVKLAKDEERFVSQAIGNWGSRVIKSTENLKPGLTLEDVSNVRNASGLKDSALTYRSGGKFTQYTDFLPGTADEIKTLDAAKKVISTLEKEDNSLIYKAVKLKDGNYSIFSSPKGKGEILKSSLEQEAKKIPKTVNVYVKSKFSEGGGYKDVPVIRKVDNVTLYQGSNDGDKRQFWTDSKKYASQFGEVKEKTGSFYQVDNGNRVTNVYVEVK